MGYTKEQALIFISHIAPIIQKEANKRGYTICSTVIAQAIIEGACGTSSLAKVYHNHFGMKCGGSWTGKSVNMKTKEEYTPGVMSTIRDNFRVYDSDEECVVGYYNFISTKRYANLKTATTYKQYAEYLKADGYATSNTYVNTLCNTVIKYNLTIYDSNTQSSVVSNVYTCGCTYTLQNNMYVRDSANGNKIKFDMLTYDGKKHGKFDEYGNAILLKGTKVTCCDVKTLDDSIWIKIPSGWVCGVTTGKVYVK